MKELFEEHRESLRPEEDRVVWGTIEDSVAPRQRIPRWIPVGALSVIGFAAFLLVADRQSKMLGGREARSGAAPSPPEIMAIPYIAHEPQSVSPPPEPIVKSNRNRLNRKMNSSRGLQLSERLPRLLEDGSRISVGGTDPVNGEAFDAMFFEHYGVNPFIDPEEDRLATFAVDVDNASYTMTRAYLNRGELPPKDAVRVEEFVNAFRHNYPAPATSDLAGPGSVSEHGTFAIHLDAAASPFGDGLKLIRVGLKGREIDVSDRRPAVLTFVVDVSGSMNREDRLELVKKSLLLLLDGMTPEDEVALVVYGSTSRTVLEHTSVSHRKQIETAIESLMPEGSTNAEAGLIEAYGLADKAFRRNRLNRVILCSDGVANVGNTGAEEILKRIRSEARRGIELTAVGFGMGNYNDVLMEKLADQGDGNYYYVDKLQEARRVFVENLTGTLQTIARQTKIQVEFNPKTVKRYRLLGYENRDVADRDFRNDAVDAGEVGAGHEVTALFEVKVLEGAASSDSMGVVRIRYEDPQTGAVTEEARGVLMKDVAPAMESAPESFRVDAAVAEFAEILRHSYWAREGRLTTVADFIRKARIDQDTPQIAELVRLIDTAARLWPAADAGRPDESVRPRWAPGSENR